MSSLVAYTSEQIPYVWPKVADFVQVALDQGSNYTQDEILAGLCSKDMQLWCAVGEEIEAAMVTSIQRDKKGLFCLLLTVGGTNMHEWKYWLPDIQAWAKKAGAEEMRIYGRRGWAKVLGFDIEWTKMSKKL